MEPYVPGEQPGRDPRILKLNTNENPYPPSPRIQKAIQDVMESGLLRKYPPTQSESLRAQIAKDLKLPPQSVLITNGSDEALRLVFQGLVPRNGKVVYPDPTYSHYPVLTQMIFRDASVCPIPLKEDLHFDFPSLKNTPGDLLIFAHPNAPTGILENRTELEELLKNWNGFVLSDEAYIDFAQDDSSLVDLIPRYPNLLVSRSFSKSYSLAGLRVGFLVGSVEVIAEINKIKDSYNLGILEQEIALASWLDQEYMKHNTNLVRKERGRISKFLSDLNWEVVPSETNFIFTKPPQGLEPKSIYEYLKSIRIYIRYFAKGIPNQYIRITVGTEEENNALLKVLEGITKDPRIMVG
jgi:histidinol-phosphate aminotransferase